MLPGQVLPGSSEGEGKPPERLPPTSKQEDGDGVKPLRALVALFCSFAPNLPTLRDTCRGQPCYFCVSGGPCCVGSVRDPKSQFLPFPAQVASGGDPVCDSLPVPASSSVPNTLESSVHSLDDPSLLFCTLQRYGRDSILLRMEGAWVQKDMVYLGGCQPRPPLSPPNQTSGLDKVTLVVEGRGRGQGDRAQTKNRQKVKDAVKGVRVGAGCAAGNPVMPEPKHSQLTRGTP